jgi:hypothetical protein
MEESMFGSKRNSLLLGMSLLAGLAGAPASWAQAPTVGPNTNMVTRGDWTTGDPFLQRQNEPSLAVSTRNASHLLGGANDYRSVDLPGSLGINEQGDAWLGVFKSFDGGQTWRSTLLPGYPLDRSLAGFLSPIHGFQAASDPMVRAGSNGLLYYSGLAFNRGPGGLSEVFLARFIDRNNKENGDPTNEVGSMTNVVPRDPVRYTGTFPVAFGSDDRFVDKPSLAVDIPRTSASCTIFVPENGTLVAETIPAGKIYIAYTVLNTPDGDKDDDREPSVPTAIMFKSSSNCGYTWSGPIDLSGANQKNQGSVIAIDPNTGTIYIAWRRFYSNGQPDAILIRKSTDGGHSFSPAVAAVTFLPPASAQLSCAPPPTGDPTQPGCAFDQFSTPTDAAFRTSDYPTLAVDPNGRVYLAWSQRQQTSDPQTSDARIMMKVSDGTNWSSPAAAIDNGPLNDDYGVPLQTISGRGHQLMPSLSFNAGKLTLAYYDLREDHTIGKFNPRPDPGCDPTTQFPCTLGAQYDESRDAVAELLNNPLNYVFNSYITDLLALQGGTLSTRRHTMEVTAAQASPNASPYDLSVPTFTAFRVSKYAFGTFPQVGINDVEQLQFNPPNLPLFVMGTTAFDGDYIEAAGAPTMVFDNTSNRWKFNTAGTNPVFHMVWADNRDVRPPLDGNWQNYVPPYSASNPAGTTNQSKFDPTQTVPQCSVGVNDSNVGMRDQNIYTAQVTEGLAVSSLQSSKPLVTNGQPGIQRAFAVSAQNATNAARSFQWTVRVIPATPTVVASFDQFNPTVTTRPVVNIPAFSSVSLPVFVQAIATPTTNVSVEVDVSENVASNPLQGSVVLNSDPSNPTLLNPDNAVFGNGTITNAEYYNPLLGTATAGNVSNNTTLLNPGQGNPGQGNPGQGNPGQGNNGYTNPNFIAALGNPGQGNPGQGNTVLLNPGQGNPGQGNNGIANPGQGNPGQGNTAVGDENFSITNQGNTGATYSVKLFPTAPLPGGITVQVMLSKLYATTRGGTAAEGTACQLVTELNTVPIASVISPTLSSVNDLLNPGQGNPGQGNPGQGNVTLALAPGESGQLTLRIAGPMGSMTPPPSNVINQVLSSLVPVVVSQAVNTVDAQAGSTTPPFSTPGGSPIFITNTLPGGASPLPDGVIGTAYNATLHAVGGTGKYTWSLPLGSLPSNLTLNSATGMISGTPVCDCSLPATFPFTVQVTDSAANTATRQLSITVVQPLNIATTSLLQGVTGFEYAATAQATGGTPPYSWSSSTLPSKLVINPSTGQISGVPTVAGTTPVTIQVTDSGSPRQLVSSTLNLTVTSPAAGGGGDFIFRGFYLPNYVGTGLVQATLNFSAAVAGDYTITLTAHSNTYDGTVIGSSTTTVTLPANVGTFVPTIFNFPSPATRIAPGSLVAFTMALVSGPSDPYFAVSSCGLNDPTCTTGGPAVETEDTTAPLSVFRRNGVVLTLVSVPSPSISVGATGVSTTPRSGGEALAADPTTSNLFVKSLQDPTGFDLQFAQVAQNRTVTILGDFPAMANSDGSGIAVNPLFGGLIVADEAGAAGVNRIASIDLSSLTSNTLFSIPWKMNPASNGTGQQQYAPISATFGSGPTHLLLYFWDSTQSTLYSVDATAPATFVTLLSLDQNTTVGQHVNTAGNHIVYDFNTATLLLTDGSTNTVLEVNPANSPVSVTTLFSGLPGTPTSIALNPSANNVFVQIGNSIYVGPRSGGSLSLFATGFTLLTNIVIGNATSGSGLSLFAADKKLNTVYEIAVASAVSVNLTPASAGALTPGQSFNETRAADVTVLTPGPLSVTSMTLSGLSIGTATSALVGARIYSSTGTPIASANATVTVGGQVTIPISATLASGATYRVGFYVQTTPSGQGSGTILSVPGTSATVNSGSAVTFLDSGGLTTTDFPSAFTPANFTSAQTGNAASVLTATPFYVTSLPDGPGAVWIGTNPAAGANTGDTALYAISFNLPSTVSSASLNLYYAVDNILGESNPGIYINGTALPNSTALLCSLCVTSFGQENHYTDASIGPLLVSGTNWLYFDAVNQGGPAGLIFSAVIISAFPAYAEPTGRLKIVTAWDSPGDVFPTSPNLALPQITMAVTP